RARHGFGYSSNQCLDIRYSAIGPSARAGRKVSAPTTITTQASRVTNSGVCVGRVPAVSGTWRFAASEPAMASMAIASGNRARNMQIASNTFQKGVLAERPPKALPLLFDAELTAYRISLQPCAPGLDTAAVPAGVITAAAVQITTRAQGISTARLAIFISCASIFLPRYSGLRPT